MTFLTTSMPKHWDRDPTPASIATSTTAGLQRLRAAGPTHGNSGLPRSLAQTRVISSHAFDRNGAAHSGGGCDRAPRLRVQIFSDLHIGVAPIKSISIAANVDVIIVAGDTCEGVLNAFAHLRRIVPMAIPIVMVIGNHELYRRCLPDELALARAHAPAFNIHLLENDCVIVGGVRFVGATFWTGYDIFGSNNVAGVMNACATGMNDHRLISWQKKPWMRFRPQEAALLHHRSLRYFTETLAVPFAAPTIVVTHTAVLWDAILPKYRSDPITGAFLSDQRALIEQFQPSMWVHGHVHNSLDLRIGSCLVLCNPHGYGSENPDFDGQLVVEVGA